MPIFEYRCRKCGHVTAVLERGGRRRKHRCEECGSAGTEKILSSFAARSGNSSAGSSSCPTGTCPLS